MTNGEINQISIPVLDFETAKQFYEVIFGWEVDIVTYEPNYAITIWEKEMNLGFYISKKIVTGGPMIVFSVLDIDATLKKIEQNGGEILQDKHEMSDGEYGAVFKDPFGNRFRLKGP